MELKTLNKLKFAPTGFLVFHSDHVYGPHLRKVLKANDRLKNINITIGYNSTYLVDFELYEAIVASFMESAKETLELGAKVMASENAKIATPVKTPVKRPLTKEVAEKILEVKVPEPVVEVAEKPVKPKKVLTTAQIIDKIRKSSRSWVAESNTTNSTYLLGLVDGVCYEIRESDHEKDGSAGYSLTLKVVEESQPFRFGAQTLKGKVRYSTPYKTTVIDENDKKLHYKTSFLRALEGVK